MPPGLSVSATWSSKSCAGSARAARTRSRHIPPRAIGASRARTTAASDSCSSDRWARTRSRWVARSTPAWAAGVRGGLAAFGWTFMGATSVASMVGPRRAVRPEQAGGQTDATRRSGQREEELLHLGDVHRLALRVGDALAQPGGDDGEAGAVERLGDGGELRDDVLAVAALLDHLDDAADLAAGAVEATDDRLHLVEVELHGVLLGSLPEGSMIPPAVCRDVCRHARPECGLSPSGGRT